MKFLIAMSFIIGLFITNCTLNSKPDPATTIAVDSTGSAGKKSLSISTESSPTIAVDTIHVPNSNPAKPGSGAIDTRRLPDIDTIGVH